MSRILPAAVLAVSLHTLVFLAGDFRPERAGPLDSRTELAVTIQLLEPSPRADPPEPEPEPPKPEPRAWLAHKPGVVFESPAPNPLAMRGRTGYAPSAPPRTPSSTPASGKLPLFGKELVDKEGSSSATVKALPVYRENPPPVYPDLARRRGYEGVVLLEVLVSEEGRVSEIEVAQSSGHTLLDRAALQAVKKWVFEPAQTGDRAVAMRVRIPVRFDLR